MILYKKNLKSDRFYIKVALLLFLLINFVLGSSIYATNYSENEDSLSLLKRGGICFRVDDHYNINNYMKMAKVFNKYNAKFCLSLNMNDFKTNAQLDSLRQIQEMGHEIMDHTPNHRTNYFNTKFGLSEYISQGHTPVPGIDHFIGNKVCLEFEKVDTSKATQMGNCNISNNIVSGNFGELKKEEIYFFFPDLQKLVLLDSIGIDKFAVLDVWEDPLNLGTLGETKYYIFNSREIQITANALKLLATESIKLTSTMGLVAPRIWIQPGGNFPQISKDMLKKVLGDELNIVAGSTYSDGRKAYNEYDPNGSEKFEMQWGDFFEDEWSADKCKKVIADGIAKHHVLIGHSDFALLKIPLDQYLMKIDSLLAWATENKIPIRTYSEWAKTLYEQKTDPYINIFPPLNIDLDHNVSELDINGVPDGYVNRYWDGQGQWGKDTNDTYVGKYCFSISSANRICRIDSLGGIEKGKNDFKIQTKGEQGDSIEVIFTFGKNSKTPDAIFKFPADTKEWKEYTQEQSTNGNTELVFPEYESFVSIDIKCSNYISGKVKISEMSLALSKLSALDNAENEIVQNSYILNQNYPNPFNPSTRISFIIPEKTLVKLKIYDILGNEVSTLVNSEMNRGKYEIDFNASNLSSGVYFYTLITDKIVHTNKMLLMK